ncbi:hypothetical protein TCAL_08979 [Tigriopus californicus]|uniref:Uncharacterized protein n=1 Tax=Tigriopus californicus TaxID=6832 RepID=A0A553PMD9_TIGCA|nr:hypothetical protein TCAL_08979 [Tigriopus californicus]|eukprot:TCALIF_08979-PA protein Name:"Protein of unknown function" AED:0.00 eAED:0.00 QI:108/1/1/1/0/0.33/3/254/75
MNWFQIILSLFIITAVLDTAVSAPFEGFPIINEFFEMRPESTTTTTTTTPRTPAQASPQEQRGKRYILDTIPLVQ